MHKIVTRRPVGSPLWARSVRWPDNGLPFDLRPLRYVLAAAENMSFSAAAQALDTKGRCCVNLMLAATPLSPDALIPRPS